MKQSERITLAITEAGGDLSRQISHNVEPFRIQWFSANRLPRPAVASALLAQRLPQFEQFGFTVVVCCYPHSLSHQSL
jgi:hypothetical protein